MVTTNGNGYAAMEPAALAELAQRQAWDLEMVEERLAELEMALDADGWQQLGGSFDGEFSRDALDTIIRRSRYAYLANPLINHALEVQSHYVAGLGVDIAAVHPAVNDVVRAFWEDPGNRAELTSDASLQRADIELSATGNVFLVLFTDAVTGRVRMRSIAVEEVRDIITDPDDIRTPWFYRRVWEEQRRGATGAAPARREALYPDWSYQPPQTQRPDTIGGVPVQWSASVMHRHVGGIGRMRFGVPETYSALDWAVAVRTDLERFATIRRAQAAFATRITTAGGRKGVAATKARLASAVGAPGPETNPPPITGSTFVGAQGGADYDLVRMGGAAPHPDDARRLGLMVAAGIGVPETILFGNADVGNLATSRTLDRPTELKMAARQSYWRDTIADLLNYAIDQAVIAPRGALRAIGRAIGGASGSPVVVMHPDPDRDGAPIDRTPIITFPDILERDVKARVEAIGIGARLLPPSAERTVARLVLAALDVDDIDAVLDTLYPPDAPDATLSQPAAPADMDAQFIAAVRDMREVLATIAGRS